MNASVLLPGVFNQTCAGQKILYQLLWACVAVTDQLESIPLFYSNQGEWSGSLLPRLFVRWCGWCDVIVRVVSRH